MKKNIKLSLFLALAVCLSAYVPFSSTLCKLAAAAESSSLPYSFSLYWVKAQDSMSGKRGVQDGVGEQTAALALVMTAKDAYHCYAHSSPGGVYPLTVSLTQSVKGAKIVYPAGREAQDIFEPDKTVHIHEGRTPVLLLFPDVLPAPGTALHIAMLACSEEHCVPIRATLPLPPLPDPLPALSDSLPWAEGAWKGIAPVTLEGGKPDKQNERIELGAATSVFSSSRQTSPDDTDPVSLFSHEAPVQEDLPFFSPRPFTASLEVAGLGKAVLFGLLAGLILNVMPCVLPVITLKINAMLQAGNDPENICRFRRHNLWFAAGILFWFIVLAFLFGLAGYAWGQIFQNNIFLLVMLGVVFILALTMFDVFHLPVLDLRGHRNTKDEDRMPRTNAFLTGLLATLLATPCSGPLLGGVLGWSLMQGLPVLITVFMATGLGMALPYLGMAIWPGVAARLPRPGSWMLHMERMLGFLLIGTCLYLLSILPDTLVFPALILLLTIAFSAWIWGTWGELRAGGARRFFLVVLCAAIPLCAAWTVFSPRSGQEVRWTTYSPELFAEQLGKRPLFVEFTADWCPTCKVLERTALSPEHLIPLAKENNLLLIRVDLTRDDPHAHNLLKSLGSASIPLLAIFPEGDAAKFPVILRDIYTVEQMRGAVKQALHELP